MSTTLLPTPTAPAPDPTVVAAQTAVLTVLAAISVAHLCNDMMQNMLMASYPLFKVRFHLSYAQVGLITLMFQLTASVLQPLVGLLTDRRPMPYSLACASLCTLSGLLLLAHAPTFPAVLLASMLIGLGSAIFHPEASRIARLASGGRHGLAQSVFQVGGNVGSAIGPLAAALVVAPRGQASIAWFAIAALVALLLLIGVGRWYGEHLGSRRQGARRPLGPGFSSRRITGILAVLGLLVFSKFFYLAGLNNYYTFYLIERFGLSTQEAQFRLFGLLASAAVGTIIGGPIGDRIGRKSVIWVSILGVAPFALALPYAGLAGTTVLACLIALVISSAFSAILVYAQELLPGRVGLVSGLFFGFAFGMGGIGAAALGHLGDLTSIGTVMKVCSFLPLLGMAAIALPRLEPARARPAAPTR